MGEIIVQRYQTSFLFLFLNQPSINSQQQSGMKYVHLAYLQMTTFLKVTQ